MDKFVKELATDILDFTIGFIAISPIIGLAILVWELGQWLSK